MNGTRIRNVIGTKIVKKIKIGIEMRRNLVQKTRIETIRTRSTSLVPRIRIGKIGTGKRIKKGIGTKTKTGIKIGIRANIAPETRRRIDTAVPRINIGIRIGIKINIPAPKIRIERKRRKKVIFNIHYLYLIDN